MFSPSAFASVVCPPIKPLRAVLTAPAASARRRAARRAALKRALQMSAQRGRREARCDAMRVRAASRRAFAAAAFIIAVFSYCRQPRFFTITFRFSLSFITTPSFSTLLSSFSHTGRVSFSFRHSMSR
jgi:hypothetical protein